MDTIPPLEPFENTCLNEEDKNERSLTNRSMKRRQTEKRDSNEVYSDDFKQGEVQKAGIRCVPLKRETKELETFREEKFNKAIGQEVKRIEKNET